MTIQLNPSFNKTDVEILEKDTVYQGHFRMDKYSVRHRLFAGDMSKPLSREVFERGHAAAALLYDPCLDKLVLIEQFRSGLLSSNESPWLLELVAGIIEAEETPEQVIYRETQEEAGLTVLDLIPLYTYWVSPGGSSERVALFCARVDATKAGGIHGLAEEGEDIRVWTFSCKEVYALVANGRIHNAISIIAIQWLQLNEEKVKQQWLNF
jgi:ADP-ribose pyrophosphatase